MPLFLILSPSYAADLPDISEYEKADGSNSPLLLFEDFNGRTDRWELPDSASIERNGGLIGTAALVFQHNAGNNSKELKVSLKKNICKLEKGKRYIFKAYYRTENMPDAKNAHTTPMVNTTDGKSTAWFRPLPYPLKPSPEWKPVEFEFVAGETTDINLRLSPNALGKVWYDDISISENFARTGTMYPIAPYALRLDDRGRISIKAHIYGESSKKISGYYVYLRTEDRQEVKQLDGNGIASFELGDLKEGKHVFETNVLDPGKKRILAEDKFTLFRTPAIRPASTSVAFDGHKRMLIDGKPFMPVGIYVHCLRTEADLKRIADAGFNTVLNYRSFSMDIQTEENEISAAAHTSKTAGPDYGTPEWRKKQKKSLDLMDRYGLKLIVASSHGKYDPVYEHPAVIAYYIADEETVDHLPRIRKIRENWSSVSPFRPVIALTCRPEDFDEYAKVCDVLGFDMYPIHTFDFKKTLINFRREFEKAGNTGLPVMAVPQFFNNGFYAGGERFKEYFYPTYAEMRSQALLNITQGTRFFCAYSYMDAWERLGKSDPGMQETFWMNVSQSANVLRTIEPWVMSTDQAPNIKVENKGETEISSSAHMHNGQMMILVVSSGNKAGEAIIHAGKDRLRSATGNTRPLGKGRYLFQSKGIASDVLYENETLSFPKDGDVVPEKAAQPKARR